MKILIGDIGNTLTKLCLVDEKSTSIKEYSIETAEITKEKKLIKFFSLIIFTVSILYSLIDDDISSTRHIFVNVFPISPINIFI